MKGYKVFNPDWTCRGFEFKIGEKYEMKDSLVICKTGFHFCLEVVDCFNYYKFNPNNKVAEVEGLGDIVGHKDDSKKATNKIKILREISWHEVLDLVNTGKNNSGYGNSGYWNSGYGNSGYWNSGDGNSGYWNSGDRNSGDRNSGDRNSGYWNSGYRNSGDRNSGDFNSCNYSAGVFCTEEQTIKIFDMQTKITIKDWRNTDAYSLLSKLELNKWIYANEMTEKEKKEHPKYEISGGYLKTYEYSEAWIFLWDSLTDEEKETIKSIPNFNAEKFEKITGIKV